MSAARVLQSALVVGVAGSMVVDFNLISSAILKTHPVGKELTAQTLWQEGPCLVYVARRLG